MKHTLWVMASLAALLNAPGIATAADVGVSVTVGQPGFYGRIDVGNVPQPVLIYPQPLIIQPAPVAIARQPIYMRVPPGHAKNWGKHCGRYNACGQPVYFVQDSWYNQVYAPQYQRQRIEQDDDSRGRGRGNGQGRGHGKGRDKD